MKQRFDIKPADVFVSFTGADREIKNKIIEYLESKNITCLESDKECCGNYIEWSIEAPNHCSLFLPIITENIKETSIMKDEYEAIQKQEDYLNRIIPISTGNDVYSKYSFGMHKSCSAIFDENLNDISTDTLDKLYSSIKKLLIHINCRRNFCPHKSSKYFIGRNSELCDIHKKLKNFNTVFISGIGGVGKTELAKKYIEYQNELSEDSFFNIIYLQYDKNDGNSAVSNLEHIVNSVVEEMPISDNLEVFHNPQTLVILDNFDVENDEYLETFLSFNCKKIITTRNAGFECYENAESVKLEVLSKSEQHKLFEKHYGYDIDIDDNNLNYILNSIAGLTVFIPIVAKQCQSSKMDLADMCCNLKEGGIPSFKDAEKFQVYKDEILLRGNTLQLSRIIFKIADLEEKHKTVLRNLSLLQFMYVTADQYKEICISDSNKNLKDLNDLIDKNWVIENKNGRSPKENTFELHPIINELVVEDLNPTPKNCYEIFDYVRKINLIEKLNVSTGFVDYFLYNLNIVSIENYNFMINCLKDIDPSNLHIRIDRTKLIENIKRLLLHKSIYDEDDIFIIPYVFFIYLTDNKNDIEIVFNRSCYSTMNGNINEQRFISFLEIYKNYAFNKMMVGNQDYYEMLIKYSKKYKKIFSQDFLESINKQKTNIESQTEFLYKCKKLIKDTDSYVTSSNDLKAGLDKLISCYLSIQPMTGHLIKDLMELNIHFYETNLAKDIRKDNLDMIIDSIIELIKSNNLILNHAPKRILEDYIFWDFWNFYYIRELNIFTHKKIIYFLSKKYSLQNRIFHDTELLAYHICGNRKQFLYELLQLLNQKELHEKSLAELHTEFERIQSIFRGGSVDFRASFRYCWHEDDFQPIIAYIKEIEDTYEKKEEYFEIIAKWYKFICICTHRFDCNDFFEQKYAQWEDKSRGFILKEKNN